jgi:hypothetical protein
LHFFNINMESIFEIDELSIRGKQSNSLKT